MIVSHIDLEIWIEQILTACGVSKIDARTTAKVLTITNLRGVDYCIRSFAPTMIRAHYGHTAWRGFLPT